MGQTTDKCYSIISGLRRSGTSMLMLALKEAGIPVLGSAFPGKMNKNTKYGNPKGYWEHSTITVETGLAPCFKDIGKGGEIVKVIADTLPKSDPSLIDKTIICFRKPKTILYSIAKVNELPRMKDFISLYALDTIDMLGYLTYFNKSYIAVFYEDMLLNPEKEMKRVCDFLGKGDYKKGAKVIDIKLNRSMEFDEEMEYVDILDKMYYLAKEGKFMEIIEMEEDVKETAKEIEERIVGCQKCGKCCKEIHLALGANISDDVKRWIELHNLKVIQGKNGLKVKISNRCRYLKNNKCKIYKNRPDVCRSYLCEKALGYK